MRIVHVVDAAQAQAQIQQRVAPPPTASPPRRVQAVNRSADPEDPTSVGTSTPDDGISLDLSPESREAARQATLDDLRAAMARKNPDRKENGGDNAAPDPETEVRESRERDAVQQLESQDREVRATQQAHAAAAAGVGSVPTYSYRVGPDGRLYAVSGEVRIDTTPVPGDPEATLRKARQIEEAAFTPGDPSPEDRRAAAMAAALAARARQELARQQADKSQEAQRQSSVRLSEVG
jgi:hypothetical protein